MKGDIYPWPHQNSPYILFFYLFVFSVFSFFSFFFFFFFFDKTVFFLMRCFKYVSFIGQVSSIFLKILLYPCLLRFKSNKRKLRIRRKKKRGWGQRSKSFNARERLQTKEKHIVTYKLKCYMSINHLCNNLLYE